MRPRHTAAENGRRAARGCRGGFASMRPRHTAAENIDPQPRPIDPRSRFNEAAAYSRGKPRTACSNVSCHVCFNEAAAYSRGKPPRHPHTLPHVQKASMRPRHTAAENHRDRPGTGLYRGEASMRPRHTAAENFLPPINEVLLLAASMRPRHTAAENTARLRALGRTMPGFNEAAAYSRGKLGGIDGACDSARVASMRPRHTAAENRTRTRREGLVRHPLQ